MSLSLVSLSSLPCLILKGISSSISFFEHPYSSEPCPVCKAHANESFAFWFKLVIVSSLMWFWGKRGPSLLVLVVFQLGFFPLISARWLGPNGYLIACTSKCLTSLVPFTPSNFVSIIATYSDIRQIIQNTSLIL